MVAEEFLHQAFGQVLEDDPFLLHLQADSPFDLVAAGRTLAAVELAELLLGDPAEVRVERVESLLVADAAPVDESAESVPQPLLVPHHHGSAADRWVLNLTVVNALHDGPVDAALKGNQAAHRLVSLGEADPVALPERPERLARLRKFGHPLPVGRPHLLDALLTEQCSRLHVRGELSEPRQEGGVECLDTVVADFSGIEFGEGGEVRVAGGVLQVGAVPVDLHDHGNAAVGQDARADVDIDGRPSHRTGPSPTRSARSV